LSERPSQTSLETFWGLLSTRSAALIAAVLLLFVFVKNAWVDEDAYITFRVIEQLFEGHGLRWNPHERVQAFTHPLWLALLALGRIVTTDLFAVAIVVSLLCCIAGLFALRRVTGGGVRWLAALALVLASRSVFDFTSSGLEQPLSYALVGGYLMVYLAGPKQPSGALAPDARARWLGRLTLLFALALLSRHDLATLLLVPQLEALHRVRNAGAGRLARAICLGALPFVAWTGFSLFYYGLPVPNTALAKLNNGIAGARLRSNGLEYLGVTCIEDAIVPIVVVGAVVCTALALRRRGENARACAMLVLGVLLNLIYLVQIGGGHMLGRFVASATFVSIAVVCVASPWPRALFAGAVAILVGWSALQPSAPLRSGFDFSPEEGQVGHVQDEREILFPYSSLHRWWTHDANAPFPDHRWTRAGLHLREEGPTVVRRANVGFMGWAAGSEVILVDPLALTDPLLARLPSRKLYRIGHFPRILPEGYLETLRTGEPHFADPEMQAYYDRIALVTQGDLFDGARLRAIVPLLFDPRGPLPRPAAADGEPD